MTTTIFPASAKAILRDCYPRTAAKLPHKLLEHDLLQLDALVDLANALPADSVEYNPGTLPIGIKPEDVPVSALSAAETIRSIEENGSWMVLKRVEQQPAYEMLLKDTLAEIAPLVETRTGQMLGLEGFIFISSPGSVTPFHFDPEHNILLQVRGTKTMTVFPADDEELVRPEAHEKFHLGQHHRNQHWEPAFAVKGQPITIMPGEGIYVPVKAPHWVQNGDGVSISLSITWRSEWSYAEADARAFNHLLRKTGIKPRAPAPWPSRNRGKSYAYRAIAKAQRILGLR
jgi:quercetin dioxygenase-like cupin family protein